LNIHRERLNVGTPISMDNPTTSGSICICGSDITSPQEIKLGKKRWSYEVNLQVVIKVIAPEDRME
jgi:hypothetical protein